MKNVILSSLLALVCSGNAFSQAISQATARVMYQSVLRASPAVNSGDGVMQKSGQLQCFEIGMTAPFTYQCGPFSNATSKVLFERFMSSVSVLNSGDDVLEKTALIDCFEKGINRPFVYYCTIAK